MINQGPSPDLILRYSKNLPRYTSYPTALQFQPFSEEKWRRELKEYLNETPAAPVSIYCHLPFCRSLCYFCACNKVIAKDRSGVEPYLQTLETEIRITRELLGGEAPPILQLHWGGGSPNFLTPEEMTRLYQTIRRAFPNIKEEADISAELDPRTTTRDQLKTLRELGFNRISLGIQDFDAKVQKAVNRLQSFESTEALCTEARSFGFKGINIDLIYGLPLQTLTGFQKTVELVSRLRPDRIALYGYAHVTWIKKTQKVFDKMPLPDPNERIALFQSALSYFTAEGYDYIGMDHFALPSDSLFSAKKSGTIHRNFMGYSTHPTNALLGFGVSAISTLPAAFMQNNRSLKAYTTKLSQESLPCERGLRRSWEDRWRAALIEQIMCRGQVDFLHFQEDWGVDIWPLFAQRAALAMIKDGLIEVSPSTLGVTPLGRFFLRNIAALADANDSADSGRYSSAV